jgi:hypothetical protein
MTLEKSSLQGGKAEITIAQMIDHWLTDHAQ